MGGADVFSDPVLVNERDKPLIGRVPMGDCGTASAQGAALACRRFFDFDTATPCHHGTLPVIDQTAHKFAGATGDHEIVMLKEGVPFDD